MLIGIQPTIKPYFLMGHHRNGSWFFRTSLFLACVAPFFVDIYICQQFVFGFVLSVYGSTLVLVVEFKLMFVNLKLNIKTNT